jgi:5-(carboxyamino)imidazole ribonucleotide mutase/phosphoribosylaminoimidazole-succinocarboxamide synthase
MTPLVPIIMGSASDLEHAKKIAAALTGYGIDYDMHVASAHKAPAYLLQLLSSYEGNGRPKVYITIAGRSNALSALVDTQVAAPVLACPPTSDSFGGADIFSSLRMPSGVAPAVILDPAGAALVAAKILGLIEPAIQQKIVAQHQQMVEKVMQEDESLKQKA